MQRGGPGLSYKDSATVTDFKPPIPTPLAPTQAGEQARLLRKRGFSFVEAYRLIFNRQPAWEFPTSHLEGKYDDGLS